MAAVMQPDDDGMVSVRLPSGAPYKVHTEEVEYFEERVRRYQSELRFTNISHEQDLDRVIILEISIWRWGWWVSRQKDWWDDPIDIEKMQRSLKEASGELRQVKKSLGLDKVTMDKERGEDSVSAYIRNLQIRAAKFGVHRNQQFQKALELFHQMTALVTLHDNCTLDEQKELHCTDKDVLEWLREIAIPEFEILDREFVKNEQMIWIREM